MSSPMSDVLTAAIRDFYATARERQRVEDQVGDFAAELRRVAVAVQIATMGSGVRLGAEAEGLGETFAFHLR